MADPLDLLVTGVGAATPVGLSAPASCAALRAGIARLGPTFGALVDGDLVAREPGVGGRVPLEWLNGGPEEIDWVGHRRFTISEPPPPESWIPAGPPRLQDLAKLAAREAWDDSGLAERPGVRVGLYMGLGAGDDPEPVTSSVTQAIGVRPVVVHAERAGRAATLVALRQAAKDFLAGTVDAALVGGVDSLLRPDTMEALRDAGALRSATRPQGILPGEGAAFLVLERSAPKSKRPLANLEAVVTEDEPTVGTEDPNIARGLSRALRKARLSARPFSTRPLAVCDLNGDRYRATEWAMASMRAFPDLPGAVHVWHPANCIGDAGAAMGAIDLVWAAVALSKGYTPGDRAVVWGASDGPERAAAVLVAVPTA